MRLVFNKPYFGLTIFLLITEILIALYVHDAIIRPYVGDILVVMLLYCFTKSFVNFSVLKTALMVLLFSFTIELCQWLHVIEKLNLSHSKIARTVIGTSFSWIDLAMYSIGLAIIILLEAIRKPHSKKYQQ